jgi:hypothetical protein
MPLNDLIKRLGGLSYDEPFERIARRGVGIDNRCKRSIRFTLFTTSRPRECGNPEGISKEGGKPASWLPCFPHSVISMACFARRPR